MVDPITDSTAAAIQSIYYHSSAALALSLWDFLTTFGDEVHCIWPSGDLMFPTFAESSSPSPYRMKRDAFKWLYISHRHFLLAIQLTCQIALPLSAAMSSPTSYDCLSSLVFMTILTQCTNVTLEFILALRIFALFGRRPCVLRLFGCLIVAHILYSVPASYSYFKS
ncbi:hypothetical protein EDC04DRAFT_93370 [Pisolithus marmoratus]|nr:hypothetical protein EDC04DRAFT_93370 [Pisolithus marmoratus]